MNESASSFSIVKMLERGNTTNTNISMTMDGIFVEEIDENERNRLIQQKLSETAQGKAIAS